MCFKSYRGFTRVLIYLSETCTLLLKYQGFNFTYTFVNAISNGSPVMESTCCQLFFFIITDLIVKLLQQNMKGLTPEELQKVRVFVWMHININY